jgi:hypothetical protein
LVALQEKLKTFSERLCAHHRCYTNKSNYPWVEPKGKFHMKNLPWFQILQTKKVSIGKFSIFFNPNQTIHKPLVPTRTKQSINLLYQWKHVTTQSMWDRGGKRVVSIRGKNWGEGVSKRRTGGGDGITKFSL